MARDILIIDDEDDIRLIAAVALERLAGWEVASVGSGEEAVRSALPTGGKPGADVLTVDSGLRVLSGGQKRWDPGIGGNGCGLQFGDHAPGTDR